MVPSRKIYKADNVAKYLIYLASKDYVGEDKEREGITNLKLQKILYFAQAYYLAKLGRPLFAEKIEAWAYGPVIPEVYRKFKHKGSDPIILTEDQSTITDEDKAILKRLWGTFGGYSASRLVDVVHSHSPWKKANASKDNKIISLKVIKEYYAPLLNN